MAGNDKKNKKKRMKASKRISDPEQKKKGGLCLLSWDCSASTTKDGSNNQDSLFLAFFVQACVISVATNAVMTGNDDSL